MLKSIKQFRRYIWCTQLSKLQISSLCPTETLKIGSKSPKPIELFITHNVIYSSQIWLKSADWLLRYRIQSHQYQWEPVTSKLLCYNHQFINTIHYYVPGVASHLGLHVRIQKALPEGVQLCNSDNAFLWMRRT